MMESKAFYSCLFYFLCITQFMMIHVTCAEPENTMRYNIPDPGKMNPILSLKHDLRLTFNQTFMC